MHKEGKILIFHLSRFGYAEYAKGMIDHLPLDNCLIFLSEYHTVPVQKPFREVRTYRNSFEFIWNSLFQLPLFLWQLSRLINKHDAKVAYFPGFHYWDLPFILMCRLYRVPVVYTIHDGILHEGEQFWTHQLLQNACIRRANHLIFLTEYMKRETQRLLRLNKPASVIPHGPIEISSAFTVHQHTPRLKLLFLGRISRYKGVELLLEAVQRCDDKYWDCLTIAGKPLYRVKVPCYPKIRLIPHWLSQGEIAELLRSHDVLVLPYASATQSGVATLGITAAIPMICTKVGGLPEQLTENEAVWVNSDVKELAEAIRLLSNHPEVYTSLVKNLTNRKQNFDWHEPAVKLAKLLTATSATPNISNTAPQ